MATIIDSLFLELGFDTTKITKGQKEANAAVKKTAEEFDKQGKLIEKQAAKFGEAVGNSTVKLLGLFATMLMGGKAAREFVQYITDADAALGRSARNLQVSTDTLSEWQNVVRESGGKAEDATSSIQALSASIANVKLGHISEQFAEGWFKIAALGGKAMDWSKPLDQSMFDLSDNLKRISDKEGPAVALQLAKMIGINEALFNVLVRGREVNKQLLEQQKQRGIAEAGNIANAQKLQKSYADTAQSGSYLGRVIGSILTPAILSVNEWLQRSATNWGNWLVIGYVKFDAFLHQVTAGWHKLVDIFEPDFAYVDNHWREMLDQMEHAFGEFGNKIGQSGSFLLGMFQQAFSSVFLWLKKSFNEIWGAVFGHPPFGDAGTTGGAIVEGLGYGSTPKSTGGGESGRYGSNRSTSSGRDRGGSSPGTRGWWTADRVSHAIEKLQAGGVSELGAKALVSRWMNVEATGGPTAQNAIGGGHYGIGQWSRARAGALWGNPDFDAQLDHAVKELHGPEGAALSKLNAAKTADEAATGASMFERAEGYNSGTGRDNFTDKTARGIGSIGKGGGSATTSGQTDPHKPGFDPNAVKFHDYFPKSGGSPSSSNATTNNSHQAHITINSSSGNPHEIAKAVKDAIDRTSYAMHGNYSLA